jgi:hypothetical protein
MASFLSLNRRTCTERCVREGELVFGLTKHAALQNSVPGVKRGFREIQPHNPILDVDESYLKWREPFPMTAIQ